tara:strand:+ start:430 stop:573 length:144 start_codon:yes stop_codon:yes gene_type:complete
MFLLICLGYTAALLHEQERRSWGVADHAVAKIKIANRKQPARMKRSN